MTRPAYVLGPVAMVLSAVVAVAGFRVAGLALEASRDRIFLGAVAIAVAAIAVGVVALETYLEGLRRQ